METTLQVSDGASSHQAVLHIERFIPFFSPVMCAYIPSANKRCKSLIFLTSERAAQPVTNKPLPCSRLPTLFFQASSHLLSAYPNPCSGFFLAFQKSSGHNSATGLNLFRLAKMPLFRATWLGQECHLVEHLVHCQHIRLGQRQAGGWLAGWLKLNRDEEGAVFTLPGTFPRQPQK